MLASVEFVVLFFRHESKAKKWNSVLKNSCAVLPGAAMNFKRQSLLKC